MNPVCLIIPPSPFLLDERVFTSLGILKVAACLEAKGVPVEVLDLSGIQNYLEAVEDYIRKEPEVEVFALTATTPQMPNAALIAERIRSLSPRSRLILGGPHPTLVWAACKKEKTSGRAYRAMEDLTRIFHKIVAGDGERAIFEAIDSGLIWKNQIIDADDPKGDLFLTNHTLNEQPFPARHLIDLDSYHYSIDGERATSLICQLGCPFGCGFCGGRASPMLRRVRTRTTENVVSEIRHLYQEYGYKGFMLYDDELNVNPQMIPMMNAIANLQEDLHVQFKLRGFIKSQLFSPAQAEAMYQAGFRWILVGFESGSPRILQNIQKRATREDNTKCLRIAHAHGLKVKALMSIGHPGESMQTIEETKDWLLENKPEDFDVTIITPYPGSPYYDEAKPVGEAWVYEAPGTKDALYAKEVDYFKTADYYKGDPNGGYQSYVWTDFLTSDQLVRERDLLEAGVRQSLQIPFNHASPAVRFEHSMGQGLPPSILKRSLTNA
jgi:anaerobic magnesium-protoporphyrin IX monomethyl ester cyclase